MNTNFNSRPAIRIGALLLCLFAVSLVSERSWSQQLTVLTYHDIVADPGDDIYAVSRSMFVAHMDYLQTHGYQPISLAQLDEYRKHPQRLPEKAIILTFDDGLKSYHDFVVPVLKTFGFPSVASIVTGWMDGKNLPPEYFGKLMQWKQVKELSRSPLVDIVSHTHDLHHGIQSNPQGSQEAASITRQYFPATNSYELESDYHLRVQTDLQHSIERLHSELGIKPSAVTWPYGLYDQVLAKTATDLGLIYQFSLQDGPTPLSQLPQINRIMLMRSDNINDFINELSYGPLRSDKRRFSFIHLDPFLKATSLEQHEQLFSELLDRLQPLQLNMVVLSPFSANADKTFFQNTALPVGADVLRRATHLLDSKLGIRHIYLYVPANLPGNNLSPYKELARLARFNGVVFDADIKETAAKFIKKLLTDVHPDLKFGIFTGGDIAKDMDFVIAKLDMEESLSKNRVRVSKLKGIAANVYLLSKQAYDINNLSLATINQRFQNLDTQHYGYNLNTAPLLTVLEN